MPSSGCGSVPQLFGIGKTVINTLKKNVQLKELGNLSSDFDIYVLWCKGRIEHVNNQVLVLPESFSLEIY